MASELHSTLRDGIAVLTLDRPVANILAPSLRTELSAALDDALDDVSVKGIVLHGAGAVFSDGLDIADFDTQVVEPSVSTLCRRIEEAAKPVVVALHGAARGAGFELALAAHARVAQADTRLALPDIRMGMIPGAGATQRLPRLVGAQRALEILLSGQAFAASDSRLAHLFDRVPDADPVDIAVDLAATLAEGAGWQRVRDCTRGFSDPATYQKTIAAVLGQLDGEDTPAHAVLRCIEAAQVLPFEQGLALEDVHFHECLNSAQARGLRHTRLAERRAAIMPELARGRAGSVDRVAIWGDAPVMGELAVSLLDAGLDVMMPYSSDVTRKSATRILDAAVANGGLNDEERAVRLTRLKTADAASVLARADLVIDGGKDLPADMPALGSHTVWAVLAGPEEPAARAGRAGAANRGLGLHVYRPAHARHLAELFVPPDAEADAVATLVRTWARAGHGVVRVTPEAGRIGRDLSIAIWAAALALAEAGVAPAQIDAAARALGFATGPFAQIDQQDTQAVLRAIERHVAMRGGGAVPGGKLLAEHTGAQPFLQQEDSTNPGPDASLAVDLHSAIVNESARLLDLGAVQRASDIDLIMIRGFGFARERGGPLFQADLGGILPLLQAMRRRSTLCPVIWDPQPRIVDMVKNGEGFFGRTA